MTFPNQPCYYSKVSEKGKKPQCRDVKKQTESEKITPTYCSCSPEIWETWQATLTSAQLSHDEISWSETQRARLFLVFFLLLLPIQLNVCNSP